MTKLDGCKKIAFVITFLKKQHLFWPQNHWKRRFYEKNSINLVCIIIYQLSKVILKENVRNFQKLKQHKCLIKYYIIQKRFCLKINFLCVFSQPHFCCFTFKNTPSCFFKYFESSDVIAVKKKSYYNYIVTYWEHWHRQNSLFRHFKHIREHSAIFGHVQTYWGTISHIEAYSGVIEAYGARIDILGALRNPCIYNRAIFRTLTYLELEASSKASRTCKMIMHIWSPGTVRTVYSNLFKYI